MARKAADTVKKGNGDKPDDDVDKIRDIIFGGQMREYAGRFKEMENGVNAALERMAKDIDKRFDALERALQAKTEGLGERLIAEAAQRKELHDVVAAEHDALAAALEKTRTDLTKLINCEATRLERHKLASKNLAQLFSEAARQLKQNGQ